MTELSASKKHTGNKKRTSRGGSVRMFPGRLHDLLEYVESQGLDSIVSWVRNGTAFMVHKPDQLLQLLSFFFGQTKYRSFTRQLNMWYFQREEYGPYKGAFSHPYFVKGKKQLCSKMSRHEPPESTGMLSPSHPIALSQTAVQEVTASNLQPTKALFSASSSPRSVNGTSVFFQQSHRNKLTKFEAPSIDMELFQPSSIPSQSNSLSFTESYPTPILLEETGSKSSSEVSSALLKETFLNLLRFTEPEGQGCSSLPLSISSLEPDPIRENQSMIKNHQGETAARTTAKTLAFLRRSSSLRSSASTLSDMELATIGLLGSNGLADETPYVIEPATPEDVNSIFVDLSNPTLSPQSHYFEEVAW